MASITSEVVDARFKKVSQVKRLSPQLAVPPYMR